MCSISHAQIARLWVHEVERVFKDRMVNEADMIKFDEFRYAMTKKHFDDCGGITKLEERPLLFCSFLQVCCVFVLMFVCVFVCLYV